MSAQKPFYQRNRPALVAVALLCVALLLFILKEGSSNRENSTEDHAPDPSGAGEKMDGPEFAADSKRATARKAERKTTPAPSPDDWAAILDGNYTAEGLMERVEATGRDYTIPQLVELERVMRSRAGSEWDPEALLYMIGMAVADHYPDAFMQEAIGTWLGDGASTPFVDDLVKQSISREIGRGQERGWRALEQIAERSRAEPARHNLRYLILHRALVEVGGLDPGQNMERVLELWTPIGEYTREDLGERVMKQAERVAAAKQSGQEGAGGER